MVSINELSSIFDMRPNCHFIMTSYSNVTGGDQKLFSTNTESVTKSNFKFKSSLVFGVIICRFGVANVVEVVRLTPPNGQMLGMISTIFDWSFGVAKPPLRASMIIGATLREVIEGALTPF
jgi:hypothetical protein